jgi:glycosyltransferase involved in cell wall biosynthesis
LGNKLLYFAKNNLKFADNIWLVSYFLADKLNFRKKYIDKIIIIPNFIDSKEYDF